MASDPRRRPASRVAPAATNTTSISSASPASPAGLQTPQQVPTIAIAESNKGDEPETTNGHGDNDGFKLRFCTVCASNNNRSMEGHLRLSTANYPVISFGTGSLVRLPGPSINQPNIYPFNTSSYDTMYRELDEKDHRLYEANGILKMLDRNRGVKSGPERWQDWRIGASRLGPHESDKGSQGVESGIVDVVITCEERCWEAVVDDLLHRQGPMNRPVHVFNIDIKDSHEEALVGGRAIVDLADHLNAAAVQERDGKGIKDWDDPDVARTGFDDKVPDILADWQERWPQFPALWTLAWF